MNATARTFVTRLATLLFAAWLAALSAACATAQSQERGWGRAELDQLLAPVALYPDPLLAQVLIASTYPDEVVEAARWSRMHPELDGEDALRAADVFDWDPSVKSLLAFPRLLQRMDESIDWTRELGDAFLAQEQDVMDAVQGLRRRARIEGSLASDDHVRVVEDGPRIQLVYASPAFVYVPYYDARFVYGRWWWPAHPPVVWAPWPGYRYVPHRPGVLVGLWWNTGVRISVGFFYGGIDWPRREVRVVRVDTWYVHRAIEHRAPQRVVVIKPGRWHHEPTRRQVVHRHVPRAPQVVEHTAPPRETGRPELRHPDGGRPEVRRPEPGRPETHRFEARRPEISRPEARQAEASRPDARQPQPKPSEVRRPEPRRPEADRPQARRSEHRQDEARQPDARRADVPQAESRRFDARERPSPTTQPRSQREARRAEVQRPQAGAVQRDASENPQASGQRGPQREARRPQPSREARRGDDRPAAQAQPPSQAAQPAERAGPRSAPERGTRNADDLRERRPQG